KHMNHINASHHLEQLASYMGSGAVAGGGHVDLAGVGLGIGDELGDRLDRKRWIDLHDERFARDPCDRHDVTNEIETELVIERGVDRVRGRGQEERMTIRLSAHDQLGCDVGASPWPIFDDEWLAETIR